jgi:hypothetical protein
MGHECRRGAIARERAREREREREREKSLLTMSCPDILSPWRQLLSLPIPCHVHWPLSYCRSHARTAVKCRKPCFRVRPGMRAGRACSARDCVRGALMRRGRAAGVGAAPWVPGWAEAVGQVLFEAGHAWGWVRAHGRTAGRAARCLPTVQSRACVDARSGRASGDSFRVVAPVAVWSLGLLLHGELVDYGNAPDNAYSQGGQELNSSAGAC